VTASQNWSPEPIEYDLLRMSLRAYTPTGSKLSGWNQAQLSPSEWTLIFDTETTVDAVQKLRFGIYQVRKGQELFEAGIFVNFKMFSEWELTIIRTFARSNDYRLMRVADFVEDVFFGIGYECLATIVGFNLPFDISRLAIGHAISRATPKKKAQVSPKLPTPNLSKALKGGFSFKLSPHKYRPRVQIRHLSSTVALIRFTTRAGKSAGRGMRRRKLKPLPRPGYFVDVHTLAAGLTSQHGSLASLAKFLDTDHRKLETESHGGPIDDNYLVYARQDVQVTWECYCKLLEKFVAHNFTNALPNRIFSEASVGKAYFEEMNIRPWRLLQPQFPDSLTGIMMSTYSGGRAEVHHRRIISQVVYCDFLSMYPSACTLMGLWQFVISNGLKRRDSTKEARKSLADISLQDLQRPDTWKQLATLVQVSPDNDVFPIRADYSGNGQDTIGRNYLGPGQVLWFTLADCIASKLSTGRAPKILEAITFTPDGIQNDLRSVDIAGNPEYRIDPYKNDFYCRVIDQRSEVKRRLKNAAISHRVALEGAQLTLKILANATSYGNFVELNVEDLGRRENRNCFGYLGMPTAVSVNKSEEPGKYFHPLIATLITGAARLMLAMTERLIADQGLDYAFCDTDSMAIAKPDGMDDATFFAKVSNIRGWFDALNPYAVKGPILKAEDANFALRDGKRLDQIEPLYCFAISAKRHALFNLTGDGQIVIRKASAHGLGHLLPPYREHEAPVSIPAPVVPLAEIGVERWHYDLWHQIIRAALDGHPDQVDLDFHPNLNKPAASRYAATTPALLDWFKVHNADLAYSDQVGPFNFLLAFQVEPTAIYEFPDYEDSIAETMLSNPKEIGWPKPIARFSRDAGSAADNCFDRETGKPIPAGVLKTYKDVLGSYHLRPEQKFLNGNFQDKGITVRRHVKPIEIRQIGKESNRWQERPLLNSNKAAEIDYGVSNESQTELINLVREVCEIVGQRELSKEIGISRQTLSKIMQGQLRPIPPELAALVTKAAVTIRSRANTENAKIAILISALDTEIQIIGLSEFASRLKIDPSNLQKIAVRKRPLSHEMQVALDAYFEGNYKGRARAAPFG